MPMARVPLSRERILEAAVRLADEGGLESLSMRRLARELGVEAMSLYNHVANKGALVDGIVDLVLEEIELPSAAGWDDAIRECAVSAHDAFIRHPWACGLVLSPSSGGGGIDTPRIRYMEWLLGRLREAGFSPELAYHAYHTLDSHILGFTMWQLGHMGAVKDTGESLADLAASFMKQLEGDYPYLAEHAEQHLAAGNDGPSEFAFGLDLLLDGLRRARDAGG
jgi:AcrR family transcriptional regulator